MKNIFILHFLLSISFSIFCQTSESLSFKPVDSYKKVDLQKSSKTPYFDLVISNNYPNNIYGVDINFYNYKIMNILHYPLSRILKYRKDYITFKNFHFNFKTDFEKNYSYFFSTEYYFFCYTYERFDYSVIDYNIERQSFSIISYLSKNQDYSLKATFSIVNDYQLNSKFYCYSSFICKDIRILPIKNFPLIKFASCIYYYNKNFDFMLGAESKIFKNLSIGATYDDFMNKKIFNLYLKFTYFSDKDAPYIFL